MIRHEDVYKIGVLGKPHGVRGEIAFSFTDDVWDRVESDYLLCDIDGILVPFFLEEYRFRGDFEALVKFQDLDSMEEVRQMSGCQVFFPHELTPEDNGDDEYTWRSFTGYSVEDSRFGHLGEVDYVDDSTQNILFHIGERLIPAAEELIDDVDHRKRLLYMTLPDGLLEL